MNDLYLHRISDEILAKVPDARVEKRLAHLLDFVAEISEIHEFHPSVFVNMTALLAMCRSYFIDVERYKKFHNLKLIESYKIAAYSAKWILKYKPIQFKIDDPQQITNRGMLYLNELFALRFGFAVAKLNVELLDDIFVEETLYTLHFRALSEDWLTLWFKALGGCSRLNDG